MAKVNFLTLARHAARIASDKKSDDVVILNVRRLTPIADYFVIATVHSTPQMNAVINSIEQECKKGDAPRPIHRDGRGSASWAVLDYGGLIVHIMSPEARRFYSLEKIWAEARKVAPKVPLT